VKSGISRENHWLSKDSLHKYWPIAKLALDIQWSRWSLLDNKWGSQQDICGSNALIYALSMTHIPAPCSYYFFYTPQHTLNQVDQRFLSDFPPDLMQSFSQLRFDGFR